jgi:hypothetical protein
MAVTLAALAPPRMVLAPRPDDWGKPTTVVEVTAEIRAPKLIARDDEQGLRSRRGFLESALEDPLAVCRYAGEPCDRRDVSEDFPCLIRMCQLPVVLEKLVLSPNESFGNLRLRVLFRFCPNAGENIEH